MPNTARILHAFVIVAALAIGRHGMADEPDTPLTPVDRSSPRATLQAFVESLDGFYARFHHKPLSQDDRAELRRLGAKAIGCLDLSEIAPSLVDSEGREAAVHLKEVLDRVPLPAWDEIPDAEAVDADAITHWRLPGTEVTLAAMPDGPKAGQWLFTTETVERSSSFYHAIAHLPYLSHAGSPGLHSVYVHSPGWMIPEGFIHSLPGWMRQEWMEEAVWQWISLVLLAALATVVVVFAFRLARRNAERPGILAHVLALAAPLVMVGACAGLDDLLTNQIRLTGPLLFSLKTFLQAACFVGWILLVRAVLVRLAEVVIHNRRLRPDRIDTQLVRLGFRLLTFLATAWMVIAGADSMGVSVTPLIAGLGVSGLAVALAAQHTIENFIAGLVLYADKPVRIGDTCEFGEHKGTVEQIGLRSTRIRAVDRTVIAIPNSEFAKLRLVNYTRRDKILMETPLGLRYETTGDQLRHVLAGLRTMLHSHPRIDGESVRVRFIGYGAYSLDIQIHALVITSDWATFLAIQEDVLLRVMDVVNESGCGFAFPSQTHYVATDTGVDAESRKRAEEQVRSLRATGGLKVAGFLDEPSDVDEPRHRVHRPAA